MFPDYKKEIRDFTELPRRNTCPPGASLSLYSAGLSNPEFNLSRPQFLPLLNERVGLQDSETLPALTFYDL